MTKQTQLPPGWLNTRLDEVCSFVRGVTYQRSDVETAPSDGVVGLLRATNIGENRLTSTDLVYVPLRLVSPDQRLATGDFVIATSSGSVSVVGKGAAVVSPDLVGLTFGAFCGLIRAKPQVLPSYLHYFASSPATREEWSATARGTNINNLKPRDVMSTIIPLAPLVEQVRIVERLDDLLSRLDAAVASLGRAAGLGTVDRAASHAARLRRSLLHAAFTGALTESWREEHNG